MAQDTTLAQDTTFQNRRNFGSRRAAPRYNKLYTRFTNASKCPRGPSHCTNQQVKSNNYIYKNYKQSSQLNQRLETAQVSQSAKSMPMHDPPDGKSAKTHKALHQRIQNSTQEPKFKIQSRLTVEQRLIIPRHCMDTNRDKISTIIADSNCSYVHANA